MAFRVDGGGGSPSINRKPIEVKKPEIKPLRANVESNGETNAAVYANRGQNNLQANFVRFRLNAQLAAPAAGTTPTITQQEARARAERIIENNGGRDNLNTDNVGRELADIARQNPADAELITAEIYKDDRIKDGDRDEVAQSFTQALSDTDLEQLAGTREGQRLLKEIETNLHQYPVHGDEAADANRIRLALDRHGIFLGAGQGLYPEIVDPVNLTHDPDASPEEVAAFVKMYPSSSFGREGYYAFIEALQEHQGDAEWLAGFYSALGAETTAQMISEVLDPTTHQPPGGYGTDPQFANAQAALVRDSLETLQKAGKLNQDGMNALVDSLRINPYIATEIFARSTNHELKAMFINAAINNGNDTWEAGALHVLNSMPSYKQEQVLNSLGDRLDPFIRGALRGETQMFSFSDMVQYGYMGTSVNEDLLTKITFGGAEKLLETANRTVVYYHAQVAVPEFSPELQNRLFASFAEALNDPKVFENFRDNPSFKDELSRLFIRNGADILREQAPDGAFVNADFINGMTKFFELTLFSPNGGELRDDLMQSVIETMSNVGDATLNPPLSQSEYERLHNGWSQQDHVEVMGGLLGMVWQAAANQQEFIQNEIMQDEARRKEMVSLFVGMAFSFLPGAGDVIGKIAGDGATFLQQIPDKIIDFTWNKAKDQLKDGSQDFLLNLLKGMTNRDALTSVNALIDEFRDVIVATNAALPNGEAGELNLRAAFQSAFSFYRDLVELQ